MLVILPPSETKVSGGDGPALGDFFAALENDLPEMSFAELNPARQAAVAATQKLAQTPVKAAKVWKLSPKQSAAEVGYNLNVLSSGTMPAMDRYQGVLYEALAAHKLHADARAFLAANVLIQSALLGPIGCADPVPAYRLSFDSGLPGLRDPQTKKAVTVKQLWASRGTRALKSAIDQRAIDQRAGALVLDLRSEGYSALSPVSPQPGVFYLRVMTRGEGGEVRALNHFNKKAKGELVRLFAEHYIDVARMKDASDLSTWASKHGITIEPGAAQGKTGLAELNLILGDSLSIQQ